MRTARLIAFLVGVMVAVRPADARPISSVKPTIHGHRVERDAVILRVRFEGGAAPTPDAIRVHVGESGTALDTRSVQIVPCGQTASVAVLVAGDPGPPPPVVAEPDRPAPDDAAGDPDGTDDDDDDQPPARPAAPAPGVEKRKLARTAIESALSGLEQATVAAVTVSDAGATFPAASSLDDALESLEPLTASSRASLELAFRSIEAALGDAARERRIVLLVLVSDVETKALAELVRQLVDRGVELYEVRIGGSSDLSNDPLSTYGAVGQATDPGKAGDLIGSEIDRCHLVTLPLRLLPAGAVELAVGLSDNPRKNPRVTLHLPRRTAAGRGTRWWTWAFIAAGAVLLVGAAALAFGRRRPGPVRQAYLPALDQDPRQGGVRIDVATMRLSPGPVGKTSPIAPAMARATEAQLPPAGLAAWLVVYRQGVPTDTLVLQTVGVTTLGRGTDVSIRFEDSTVSSHHAKITARAGQFVLEDTESTHGITVDGQKITTRVQLKDGMMIELGQTRARFKSTR